MADAEEQVASEQNAEEENSVGVLTYRNIDIFGAKLKSRFFWLI